VSLGVVSRGQRANAAFSLANRGSLTLTIERIETSCACLSTTPGPIAIEPGGKKLLDIQFDPFVEPDFHGSLSIDVTGYARSGVAFHTLANLEVRTEYPEEGGELVPLPSEEAHP